MTALVLFDLDDTLLDHRGAVDRGLLAHRIALGGAVAAREHAHESARWTALEEEHYPRYLSGELDFEGQRRERARAFMRHFAIELDDAAASTWFDDYFARYRAAWELHHDALPTLAELEERGIRTGIITNGDPAFQARKLAAVGLGASFPHVVASGAFGRAKPDPAIFLHAVALFGAEPARSWYVGDRLATDALGAAAAGLTGVWLERSGRASAEELDRASAAGVAVIRSLRELPALLG